MSVGFPLYEALEDPKIIEWLRLIPWLKDAFIDGRIQGVVFMSRKTVINVDRSMAMVDIAILESRLKVFVEVLD